MRSYVVGIATLVGASLSGVGCSRGSTPAPAAGGPDSGIAAAARPSAPPNALAVPSASVEAVVNPEHLPAYAGPTGSVEGTILVEGPQAPDIPDLDFRTCPAGIDVYGKLFRSGSARPDGKRPLADAVVVVVGYGGFYLPDKGPVEQVVVTPSCGYGARSIAMTYGQRLEVVNDSKYAFAPHLAGIFQAAVMIAPPGRNGDPVKLYPPKPGHYLMMDTMQSFVREDLFVLRQPLHAVTDLAGHFRIDGVPVGKLSVGASLATINADAHTDVDVRASVVEHVELTLVYTPHETPPSDAGRPHIIP
jgi:hypothetical protein